MCSGNSSMLIYMTASGLQAIPPTRMVYIFMSLVFALFLFCWFKIFSVLKAVKIIWRIRRKDIWRKDLMQCRKYIGNPFNALIFFFSSVCTSSIFLIMATYCNILWQGTLLNKSRFGWPLVADKKEIRILISHTNCQPHGSNLMYLGGIKSKREGPQTAQCCPTPSFI